MLPIAVVVFFCSRSSAEVVLPTFYNGEMHYTTITDKMLKASPRWDPKEPNPPLSIHRARQLADDMRTKFVRDTKVCQWKLESIQLVPAENDRWYWLVDYQESPRPGFGLQGFPGCLRLVVMMDGTVVMPNSCP